MHIAQHYFLLKYSLATFTFSTTQGVKRIPSSFQVLTNNYLLIECTYENISFHFATQASLLWVIMVSSEHTIYIHIVPLVRIMYEKATCLCHTSIFFSLLICSYQSTMASTQSKQHHLWTKNKSNLHGSSYLETSMKALAIKHPSSMIHSQ